MWKTFEITKLTEFDGNLRQLKNIITDLIETHGSNTLIHFDGLDDEGNVVGAVATLTTKVDPKPEYKWVKNIMTRKWIQIEEDTPFCCDPSTETYWSM